MKYFLVDATTMHGHMMGHHAIHTKVVTPKQWQL